MSDSEYKIEDDVPRPEKKTKYPFGDMKVDQSVFIPGKTSRQVANAMSTYRRKGMKFTTEYRTEDGVEGTRVWRDE